MAFRSSAFSRYVVADGLYVNVAAIMYGDHVRYFAAINGDGRGSQEAMVFDTQKMILDFNAQQ